MLGNVRQWNTDKKMSRCQGSDGLSFPAATQEAAAETQGLPKLRLRNRRQETSRSEASANWWHWPLTRPGHYAQPEDERGLCVSRRLAGEGRWTTLNTKILRRGIRTTKVVNPNVGIRIQPATPPDYRQLVVPENITEVELSQDLARQGIHVLSYKRMIVGQTRRPIPLVLVQLTKNDQSKEIFRITHVCGINITVESKLRNCHSVAVCVTCVGPHQTAERAKPRDPPAKSALVQDLHTANYKGCSKSPYANKKEVPIQPPKTAKVAIATKPSYAAAVKKNAAKKTKTSKKGKTPSTASGPKSSPKKLVKSQPLTKPSPVIVEEIADYDAFETTFCPTCDVYRSRSGFEWNQSRAIGASFVVAFIPGESGCGYCRILHNKVAIRFCKLSEVVVEFLN
ncbi:hypothetical protein Trydic_g18309 [Trypoxylus dichotomus]